MPAWQKQEKENPPSGGFFVGLDFLNQA